MPRSGEVEQGVGEASSRIKLHVDSAILGVGVVLSGLHATHTHVAAPIPRIFTPLLVPPHGLCLCLLLLLTMMLNLAGSLATTITTTIITVIETEKKRTAYQAMNAQILNNEKTNSTIKFVFCRTSAMSAPAVSSKVRPNMSPERAVSIMLSLKL